jgi:hypothetical protein
MPKSGTLENPVSYKKTQKKLGKTTPEAQEQAQEQEG